MDLEQFKSECKTLVKNGNFTDVIEKIESNDSVKYNKEVFYHFKTELEGVIKDPFFNKRLLVFIGTLK